MLMALSRRRGSAARTSGQARPVGWSEPTRLFAAEQRLIVLIEGTQLSCRGTIPQAAIQAGFNVVTHQRLPNKALVSLEQYPYRSTPNASHTTRSLCAPSYLL